MNKEQFLRTEEIETMVQKTTPWGTFCEIYEENKLWRLRCLTEEQARVLVNGIDVVMNASSEQFKGNVVPELGKVIAALVENPPNKADTVFAPYAINPSLATSGDSGEPLMTKSLSQLKALREEWKTELSQMNPEDVASLVALRYLLGKLMPYYVNRRVEAIREKKKSPISLSGYRGDISQTYWYELDGGGAGMVGAIQMGKNYMISGVDNNLYAKLAYLFIKTPYRVAYCIGSKQEKAYFKEYTF